MLSIPDMALLGAAALLLFGPEQLPRVARKAGNVMREIQNTSQSFIREMERAADIADAPPVKPYEPPPYDPAPYDAHPYEPTADEAVAFEDMPTAPFPAVDPPAPEPGVIKLAEPRPAPGLSDSDGLHPESLHPAEPAPEPDHPLHL